jgi:VCBS repeat protein
MSFRQPQSAPRRGFDSPPKPGGGQRKVQKALTHVHYVLAQIFSYIGNIDKAIAHFQSEYDLAAALGLKQDLLALEKILGIAKFRRAEVDNWARHHHGESTIFPLSTEAQFAVAPDAADACQHFVKYLDQHDDLEEKWLLNLSCITLGQYPHGVPKKQLISPATFQTPDDIGRFVDVAPALGLAVLSMAGGVVMDDFDNDGLLDLVVSTGDHCQPLYYFHNNGDGTFGNYSARAGHRRGRHGQATMGCRARLPVPRRKSHPAGIPPAA